MNSIKFYASIWQNSSGESWVMTSYCKTIFHDGLFYSNGIILFCLPFEISFNIFQRPNKHRQHSLENKCGRQLNNPNMTFKLEITFKLWISNPALPFFLLSQMDHVPTLTVAANQSRPTINNKSDFKSTLQHGDLQYPDDQENPWQVQGCTEHSGLISLSCVLHRQLDHLTTCLVISNTILLVIKWENKGELKISPEQDSMYST